MDIILQTPKPAGFQPGLQPIVPLKCAFYEVRYTAPASAGRHHGDTRKRALAEDAGFTVTHFLRLAAYSCCAAAAVSLMGLGVAGAEIKAVPQASIDYEHNSNIFAVPAGDPLLVAQGDLTRADTIGTYMVGVNVTGAWGLQQLSAQFEGREIRYNHYTQLNHSEYLGAVDFHWSLGQLFDGNFDVRRDHRMAPFMNRESTQLEVDTNQDETANINFKISGDFRLEAGYLNHDSKTPLQGFENSEVEENTERLALRYTGVRSLSYGLEISQLNGEFKNSVNPSKYKQDNYNFVFGYGATGSISQLTGSLGYSKREYDGSDATTSGLTGSIAYARQVTAKTAIKAELRRAINIYVVGGGTETDTSASLGATWAATGLITVAANTTYIHAAYGPQAGGAAQDLGRSDQYTQVNLSVGYQMLRWLSLRPYGRYETRHSNRGNFGYDGTVVGIELHGQYQ
jgi:hypothetical protein